MRRCARNIVGIWLALGVLTCAACAPVTMPGGSNASNPASAGSSPSSYSLSQQPDTHFPPSAAIDNDKSAALTNYLHSRQLPLVGARVLASDGGPHQAILYGYVATPFGRADAIDKARQYFNDPKTQIDNRITIEPDLATPGTSPDSTTANNDDLNNPDLQKYQQQQNQQLSAQQRAYMNQGSPFGSMGGSGPLSLFLPMLSLGFGGGGSGFGIGGGGMGMSPFGSPYGSPYASPYPAPSYPSSGYPGPYGP